MGYSSSEGVLSSLSLFGAPEQLDQRAVPWTALLLVGLLVGVVPAIAVPLGLTGAGLIALVVIGGLCYGLLLILTDTVLEGLCSALFVLVTFKANVPTVGVLRGGRIGEYTLNIMLVDVVAIPLALVFAYRLYQQNWQITFRRDMIAGYALAGCAGWAFLAAIAGNGPSTGAATIFAINQFRHLLLFVIGVISVRYIGIRNVIYSLLIAVAGHLAIALVEVINRGALGLSYLGDSSGKVIDTVTLGPLHFQAAMYPGGFAGSSRTLIALLLLTLPFVIGLLIGRSRRSQAIGAISILCGVFLIRVGQTDSGTMALLLSVGAMIAAMAVLSVTDKSTFQLPAYLAGGTNSLIAGIGMLFLHIVPNTVRRPEETSPSTSVNNGITAVTDGTASSGADQTANAALGLMQYVPFIGLHTLGIRLTQYAAAVDIASRYPLFGLGGANFPWLAQSYGLPRRMEIHSVYFSYLAGIGIPGLILFLTAIAVVFVTAVKRTIHSVPSDRPMWAGIVCGLIGFLAYSFWTTVHGGVAFLTFWALAGAIVGTNTKTLADSA